MERSESIGELAKALAKFQGEVEQPSLNKAVRVRTNGGGSYDFHYADLAECKRATRETLSGNGLSVAQLLEEDGSVLTVLMHSSGQWISSRVRMPVAQAGNPQSLGSAITYARRYSYCAILGLVGMEDDDGNTACGNAYGYAGGSGEASAKARAADTRPEITLATLGDGGRLERICAWLRGFEERAANGGDLFDIKSVLDRHYIVSAEALDRIRGEYLLYKANKNLE